MKGIPFLGSILVLLGFFLGFGALDAQEGGSGKSGLPFPVVDTGQDRCFGERAAIDDPKPGQPYFGQDAQIVGNTPTFTDNGDGTVTDRVTGLGWQKTPDFKTRTWEGASAYAASLELAGKKDWRLPSMKELFSIADFRGNMRARIPYIDTRFFDFRYPDPSTGARDMDAQYWSSNLYVGTTMAGDTSAFGFNFADGRIKSYPVKFGRGNREGVRKFVRCVRGKPYGTNDFKDNGDGTVTDRATGLTWMKGDSGKAMNWKDALAYAEKRVHAGHDDWRLPNVKELQSIVDYGRAPDARRAGARGPAIDPVFRVTRAESWFWSSTTHIENQFAYYVCFGRALSARRRNGEPMNAHGAGAVRSDPKSGDPSRWPDGLGPQADEIRILNFVRCVRGGAAQLREPLSAARRGTPEGAQELFRRGDFSVVTVGTGAPRYNPDRAGPCALVRHKDTFFLVDMGNGTQAKLTEAEVDPRAVKVLMLTHHHLDHNEEFIPALIKTRLRGGGADVVGPPGTAKFVDFILEFFEKDLAYRAGKTGRTAERLKKVSVRDVKGGETFTLHGVEIQTAKVIHAIHTVAYRFEAGGASIVISGDTSFSKNLIELAKGADILVMDSGAVVMKDTPRRSRPGRRRKVGVENPERAHASLEDVGLMAQKADVKKLVLTHFGIGEVDEGATRERIAAYYKGEIIFGVDLLEVVPAGGAGPPDSGETSPGLRFIRRLDRDGDGKVSPEEFDGPAHDFPRLDRNGDGYITEDEAPSGPPGGRRR
jgi:ribonuclease BN (tRNA processing enzyme)